MKQRIAKKVWMPIVILLLLLSAPFWLIFAQGKCNICLAASNLEFLLPQHVKISSKEDLDNNLLMQFPVGTEREAIKQTIGLSSRILISKPFHQNKETLKYTFGADLNGSYQVLYYLPASKHDRTGLGIRMMFDQSDRLVGVYSEYYDSKSTALPQFLINQR